MSLDTKADENELKAHDYESVLEMIGFGKAQWIIVLTAGLLLMMVLNETMGMGVITIASQCDFATSSVDKAVMSAASFIGILVSSYFWGFICDRSGRRVVLMYATLVGNVISFFSMLIPYYWLYVVMRFFVGVFIAGASSATYAYLGEFFVPKKRPIVVNYASIFVGLSTIYVPAVAWPILSMTWHLPISDTFDFRPWRLLMFFNLLPGLIAVLILSKLPESPKFLLAVNKKKEAYDAVNWLCMCTAGRNLSDLKVFEIQCASELEEKSLLMSKNCYGALIQMWRETRPLFKQPHVTNFIISCIVVCGMFLSSSGMGLWYPEIQNQLGSNTDVLSVCQVIDASFKEKENNTVMVCDDTINHKSLTDSIIYGGCLTVGYLVLGVILNPLGRKMVIVSSLTISSLCALALIWILNPIAIVVTFCIFLMLPALCISVMSGAVVDLVPTHLRGKALCISLMIGRSGVVIGSNIIGVLLETHCIFTFSFFSGCVLVCAALTLLLPI